VAGGARGSKALGSGRALLGPAVMQLLGRANWWLASWLAGLPPGGRANSGSGNEPAAYPVEVR
jgi:hypothetical protein